MASCSNELMKTEYSETFDEKRKGLIEQSYYKYGPARMNFSAGNVNAVESLKMCLAKFEETGILNICATLQIMPCSGSCFRNRANTSNIRILMNLPDFSA